MTMELDSRQIDLQEKYRDLGQRLGTRLADRTDVMPDDVWAWCGEQGLLRLVVPEELGGLGYSALDTVLAMEGLGLGCSDLGFLFALNAHIWGSVLPLATLGDEEQIRQFLPPLLDGRQIGAHAITEPGAGSDVRAMEATVTRDADQLVLNGHKQFITAAPVAKLFVIYARQPGAGEDHLSAVIVPAGTPGLSVRDQPKLGLRGAPMGEVLLDECRVPASNLLGEPGSGMAQFTTALEWERCCILAPVLGAMQRQLDRAVRWSRQRRQFGQTIGRFQAVSGRVVDMKLRLDIGQLLLYRAAGLKEGGRRAPLETSEAKLYISEAFVSSSLDAMQIQGGRGYLADAQEAIDLRDAPAGTLFSGTSEIQRNIIARFLGL